MRWRAFSKVSGYGRKIRWICVDASRIRKKNLRFHKFPDTYGRGLKLPINNKLEQCSFISDNLLLLLASKCYVKVHKQTRFCLSIVDFISASRKPSFTVKFQQPSYCEIGSCKYQSNIGVSVQVSFRCHATLTLLPKEETKETARKVALLFL